ncbi:MAG: DUF3418 domain-containing protein, partial [Phycisphaerales bacterium]
MRARPTSTWTVRWTESISGCCWRAGPERTGEALVAHRHARSQFLREEYRVSLFAQELRTRVPVSDERLARALRSSPPAASRGRFRPPHRPG